MINLRGNYHSGYMRENTKNLLSSKLKNFREQNELEYENSVSKILKQCFKNLKTVFQKS